MRWIQGVLFQTLGKPSSEIYYAAIHPNERRRIKPMIDTLAERWSDAAVGILLILVLHVLHVPLKSIAIRHGRHRGHLVRRSGASQWLLRPSLQTGLEQPLAGARGGPRSAPDPRGAQGTRRRAGWRR